MVAEHAEGRGIVGGGLPRLPALSQAANEAGDAGRAEAGRRLLGRGHARHGGAVDSSRPGREQVCADVHVLPVPRRAARA
eukprot:13794399-Alexandrium_andersonii.AAC.1